MSVEAKISMLLELQSPEARNQATRASESQASYAGLTLGPQKSLRRTLSPTLSGSTLAKRGTGLGLFPGLDFGELESELGLVFWLEFVASAKASKEVLRLLAAPRRRCAKQRAARLVAVTVHRAVR